MKLAKFLAVSAVFTALAVGLSGCDMAEQAGRELAAKAEQSAKQMAQETLKESVITLNEKLDQAQKSAETWIDQPPPASNEPLPADAPEAAKPVAPVSTTIES
ncbi:MAG: hypothetical protein Q7U01_09530 [Pseudomonas sp.]|nr:hypothetical protein [Pseudomonas sp.]